MKHFFSAITIKKAILIIVAIGILAFFNSLFNNFVADDTLQIVENPQVHSIKNIPNFFSGGTFASGGGQHLQGNYYRPIMVSFYSLLYSLFGANPFFFHLFQVLVHILNAVLVFLFFKHFFGKYLSLFLSITFLIHPINAESVVYISALQDTLFFCFGMLALLSINPKRFSFRSILLTSFLLLLSLLSKETGILFIPAQLALIFVYRRKHFKAYFMATLTVFILFLVLRFAAVGMNFTQDKTFPFMRLTLFERMANIPGMIGYYLTTFFFPKNLAMTQNWFIKSITFNNFCLPALLESVFLVIFFILAKCFVKEKNDLLVLFFFGFWFILGLGFHLQVIPLDQTVADHWFYFPMVGLLGILGVFIEQLNLKNKKFKAVAIFIVIMVIIALLTRLIIRNSNWKDGLTLYTHDTKVLKDNFALENSLGYELFKIGKLDESIYHLEKSNKLLPDWYLNLNNLGVAYSLKWEKDKDGNDFKKAENYYLASIANNRFYLSYENLAKLYISKKELEKAKQLVGESLKIYPENSKLWLFLSDVEYKLGNQQAAIEAIEKSYLLEPTENKREWYLFLKQ